MITVNEYLPPEYLQTLIGYRFQDMTILMAALTRRAYVNEHKEIKECMDPLATVGDAILDAVSVCRLYNCGIRTPEKLTTERSEEVKRDRTRGFAKNHSLQRYVLWGDGENKTEVWNTGNQALDTVFEALIGAVFLDTQAHDGNGITVIGKMLERLEYFN